MCTGGSASSWASRLSLVTLQVSALALEPISSGTWLVVDGEKVPYTRLHAQVHAGLCKVLVAPCHQHAHPHAQ
jgi:hypothetical protein